MSYHLVKINKGVLGESSKIMEELEELMDAEAQGSQIMAHLEASDLYGALLAWCDKNGTTMEELAIMADITSRAFKSGQRK